MTRHRLNDAERETYRRYAALALPRHTSYPIAPVWKTTYGPRQFREDLARSAADNNPLALYVHIPFCEKLCYYCACTKEIVPAARRKLSDPAETFLAGLEREIELLAPIVGGSPVHQLHLGGGSPTFLSAAQLERLWNILTSRFKLDPGAEIALEIDPRITTREQLATLRRLGFNRVSLGIQDFHPKVQAAVNRIQPFEQVRAVVDGCRELGFGSINFDLIYGLPYQTLDSMSDTLDKTLTLSPDRIAFFRLAVIPDIFRWQNVFREVDLPSGDLALDLNLLALNRFEDAGFDFIGLDHFARPDEALALARKTGTLQRNFQGMTTGKQLDLVGLGPSAISQLGAAFAQNHKSSADWSTALTADLAIERGLALSPDDRLRREVLQQLYGVGGIDKCAIESSFGIDFDEVFASELDRLHELEADGLVLLGAERIELTPLLGRFLVRVVAAVFDRYLPPDAFRVGLPSSMASRVG